MVIFFQWWTVVDLYKKSKLFVLKDYIYSEVSYNIVSSGYKVRNNEHEPEQG